MRHLLLIYASQTGHTAQLADAVCRGASALADEVELRRLPALEASLDDLLWCHGLIVGTPENFGYMAGAVKDFFDRTFYPAQGRVEGLPYAVFVSAGNDGTGAVAAIERIARGYPLKPAMEAVIVRGEPDADALARCEELGQTMAAGIAYGMF
ncbi:MAG: flavodoxin family protein [Burkholderiales bacterium]|nr:flavodoxin family protein [Burkholderiales bacterium]